MLALAAGLSPAAAQTPPQDTATAPALDLSTAQRQAIFQSISKTRKNNAAPSGYRASLGAHVPEAIKLEPVPDTLVALIPKMKSYEVAMVEKQVVVVDPKSKSVVAVVTGAQP